MYTHRVYIHLMYTHVWKNICRLLGGHIGLCYFLLCLDLSQILRITPDTSGREAEGLRHGHERSRQNVSPTCVAWAHGQKWCQWAKENWRWSHRHQTKVICPGIHAIRPACTGCGERWSVNNRSEDTVLFQVTGPYDELANQERSVGSVWMGSRTSAQWDRACNPGVDIWGIKRQTWAHRTLVVGSEVVG